jgi:hypothetical protein
LEVSVNEIQLGEEFFIQYLFHDFTDLYSIEEKLKENAKKLDILNKFISIANQATNLSNLLNKTINSIIEFLDLKGCCIYLVDKTLKIATIKAHKGLPEFFFENNNNIEISKSPYEIVYTQGVALFYENFPEMIKQFFKNFNSSLGAVIPLFSKFEIIGSINMLLSEKSSISVEDMELIISIALEIGTAIEKMKNQEELIQSESKSAILLKHIPFSIFRISIDGIITDIKLEKKIKIIFNLTNSIESFIGRSIHEILPEKIANEALLNIEKALETQESIQMKFFMQNEDNQILFRSDIIPINKNEVLTFLQNLTRTW